MNDATVYDAGAFIAAERNDHRFWTKHKARLLLGDKPRVPATVLAQVSRSSRQVQLRRLLTGCAVVDLDEAGAHAIGQLLGRSKSADIVDASVVVLAAQRPSTIVTSDRRDIERLLAVACVDADVVEV